jgi:hypothetical protein
MSTANCEQQKQQRVQRAEKTGNNPNKTKQILWGVV